MVWNFRFVSTGHTEEVVLTLQIKKRGAAPLGGGQIIFKCPIVRNLKTLQFLEKGKIKKIRGVA
jgi:RNA 3'-terminal phosphate cyclase-like protein